LATLAYQFLQSISQVVFFFTQPLRCLKIFVIWQKGKNQTSFLLNYKTFSLEDVQG